MKPSVLCHLLVHVSSLPNFVSAFFFFLFATPPQVILDPKTSKRIFELARDQQEELQEQPDDDDTFEDEFTRPRMNDLEDEDEDEVTEEYEGFLDLDHEEHELVRLPLSVSSSFVSNSAHSKSTLATSEHSIHSCPPMPASERHSQILFLRNSMRRLQDPILP